MAINKDSTLKFLELVVILISISSAVLSCGVYLSNDRLEIAVLKSQYVDIVARLKRIEEKLDHPSPP